MVYSMLITVHTKPRNTKQWK